MANSSPVTTSAQSQTIITIIQVILQAGYFAIMSRLLTTEDFGLFAVLTAVTTIFSSITEAGLGASIIQKKDAPQEFISTAFSLSAILGLSSMLILIATSSLFSRIIVGSSILTKAFCFMSVTLFLTNITSVVRALYMKKLAFMTYGKYEIAALFISSVIGISLAYYGAGFYAIIVAMVANQAILTCVLLFLNKENLHWGIKRCYVKEIVSYGGWLTGSVIVRTVAQELDRLVLSRWMSVAKLGLYNRPAGIVSQATSKIIGIFDTILFPILSNMQDDKERIKASYKLSFELITALSTIASFSLILCSDLLITIFLGSRWIDLGALLDVIIVGFIFIAFNRIQDCFYRSLGYVKFYFITRVVLFFATLLSLYIGCKYDLLGVAWAIIVARTIELLVKFFYMNKKVGISSWSLITQMIRAGWLPVLLFCICYSIKRFLIEGPYVATAIYILSIVVVLLIFPNAMGQTFNNTIRLRLLSTISSKIKHE